ncbi:hypothetical protein [Enterococcus faecalis]|uniref:hypothetical protein n=1 Tax=Enterococcus faecalis TaxID=1351 RepID=UPI0030C81514
MTVTLQQVQEKLALLQEKHESDIDLMDHNIGKDSYCLLCEQYKELLKQEQVLLKQERAVKKIQKEQKEVKINENGFKEIKLAPAIGKIEKQLFEITVKDGTQYLVYARDLDQVARLLGISPSQISKHAEVPVKYWDGLYIESENGALTTVRLLVTSKRARILATYAPSMNQNIRHYCFNDTPFEYIVYDASQIELLERFVAPYPVTKTKKFKTTGRVMIPLPTGAIGVSEGEVLVKITEKVIVSIEKEDFEANFSEEENLVWTTYK